MKIKPIVTVVFLFALAVSARADFKVYFLRHGQTDWNVEKRLQGSIATTRLTEKGRWMAEETGSGMAAAGLHFDKIYTSPYLRARETAELVAAKTGPLPIVDARLREMCFGKYEGQLYGKGRYPDENLKTFFEGNAEEYVPQGVGAESFAQVQARLRDFLEKELAPLDGRVTNVLCVAHSLVLKSLVRELAGAGAPASARKTLQPNCCVHTLQYANGRFTLVDAGKTYYPVAASAGANAAVPVKPGLWKTFKYTGADVTNDPIVFSGWAKADVREVMDFCIWLDVTYENGEHTYGRCAYFDRNRKDWQQARGVFKPGYRVTAISVNALFRGNNWDRKGAPIGTCAFRDFALERRAGTNEDFVVTSYSNRPFENTIEEISDHFDGQKVTRGKRITPHAEAMTSPLPDGHFAIWASHSMRKITPLTFPSGSNDEQRISIEMAKNERESAQVLVSMPADLEWTACELELPTLKREDGAALNGELKWERQAYLGREPGYVPHPCPIPDHEKWFPEILLPAAPMRVRACSTQGAWLTVYAATNALPGVYSGDVVVKEKGVEKGRLPMRVAVSSFEIPWTFSMPNAFALMDCYLRRVYGKDWKRFRRAAQDVMLDHRLNPDDISRTELPEIEDLLHARERGMNCFNLLNVVPPSKNPHEPVLICKPEEVFNEQFNAYFFGKLKPYVEELKKFGLDKLAYVYGFDERGEAFYEGIRKFWERMQRELPGIPLMNTAKNYCQYAGGLGGQRKGDKSLLMGDWYCPVTWHHDFEVSEEIRRLTGKKIWWYTCCSGGFSNYEANMVERRMFGLQTWQVKADGFLFWMMNYWHSGGRFSEQDTYFPNFRTGHWAGNAGDGFLIFPGESHVLPTIRLAQIRDGMEDYEFALAHDRLFGREPTMKIVEQVVKFPGTGNLAGQKSPYDADGDHFLAVRRQLLRNLSK